MSPILATSDEQILDCLPVMKQLRPHLEEADWLKHVRMMYRETFRLAYIADAAGEPRCVAGFRVMHLLYSGKTLYVDDLVTDAAYRSRGYGDSMVDWLIARARGEGCNVFSLDSGTQRVDAHRFYMRKRLTIGAFHFALVLD